MSIIRTRDRSAVAQVNGFRLRRSGVLKTWPTSPPTYINVATLLGSVTTMSASWPANTRAGDFGILVIESNGDDATSTPSGWTHFPGSPVVDVADATGSKLNVLYKYAESDTPASTTVADAGDHVFGGIHVFRNVSPFPNTFATATSIKTTASTTATWPDLTTPSPQTMVISIASRPNSVASGQFSAFTNAGLANINEVSDSGTTNGSGGGFVLVRATKATQGAIGASTATIAASVTNALFVVALEPSIALAA